MEKDKVMKEVDMQKGQKMGDLKNMTEVGKAEKKKKEEREIQ